MTRRSLLALALVAAPALFSRAAPAPKGAPAPELAFSAEWKNSIAAKFLVFSPDGESLVAGGGDGVLRCWDARSGKESFSVADAHKNGGQSFRGSVYGACFSPDGKTLFSRGGDDAVRLWDPATGKRLGSLPEHANTLAIAPDGKTLACSTRGSLVKVWDLASRKVTSTVKIKGSIPPHVGFGPEGKALALAGDPGDYEHVGVHEAATGKRLLRLGPHKRAAGLYTFIGDGLTAAFVGSGDHTVRLWSLSSGTQVAALRLPPLHRAVGLAITADRTRAAVSCRPIAEDGSVRSPVTSVMKLFDLETGKELWELPSKRPGRAAFSPDGRSLALGLRTGGVEVWKIPPRSRK